MIPAPFFLILWILASVCLVRAECPIECYCETGESGVTSCNGDKLLTRFPHFEEEQNSSRNFLRLELHSYLVPFLERATFLQLFSRTQELSLTRNGIERLDNDTFQQGSPLPLRLLDLSSNFLQVFVGGPRLKRLKVLDLSSQQGDYGLQQVSLAGMERLESLNLRENRLKYLSPNVFQSLKYLQYVNLDANSLTLLDPSIFSNLPALGHLILSSNPGLSPVNGIWSWNSKVQFLDLSHTNLTKIPATLTRSVRDFRASNNQLRIIRQTDFESYPNLGLLVLDDNEIEFVEDDAFGRLEYLTRLWMNGNRLSQIPPTLPPSLASLHLEDNRISNLTSTDFHQLSRLTELNLHNNKISEIPPFTFSELVALKKLDLRANLIDSIYSDSFSNLSQLAQIDLSQNRISVIVSGAFNHLEKVSLLQLSRLQEPNIQFHPASTFSPLKSLKILELEDSPGLAGALLAERGSLPSSLVELNIQRCELKDLSSVGNFLEELGDLKVIKLSGNEWTCEVQSVEQGRALTEVLEKVQDIEELSCQAPEDLKGKLVKNLNFTEQFLKAKEEISLAEESGESGGEDESATLAFVDLKELTGIEEEESESEPAEVDSSGKSNTSSSESETSTTTFLPPSLSPKRVLAVVVTSANNISAGGRNNQTNSAELSPSSINFAESDGRRPEEAEEKRKAKEVGTRSYFDETISSGKTETNDDNTIIDESSSLGESIDGFPSSGKQRRIRPKALFYLGRENKLVANSKDPSSSSIGTTIIIKTMVISASICLISVLLISLAVHKANKLRHFLRQRKQEEEESNSGPAAPSCKYSYSRFGRGKADLDSESVDHVELSGITNRLYGSGNEEIYHIT